MIKPRKYRKSNEIGKNLLKRVVIQIDDINGVPSIYVGGQKLNGLIKVAFDWNTDTDCPGYKKLEIKKYTKTKYCEPIKETMISESAYNKWKWIANGTISELAKIKNVKQISLTAQNNALD